MKNKLPSADLVAACGVMLCDCGNWHAEVSAGSADELPAMLRALADAVEAEGPKLKLQAAVWSASGASGRCH